MSRSIGIDTPVSAVPMLSRVCMIIRSGPLRSMPTRTSYSSAPMDTPFCYPQDTPGRVEFHKSQAMGNRLTEITDIAPLVVLLRRTKRFLPAMQRARQRILHPCRQTSLLCPVRDDVGHVGRAIEADKCAGLHLVWAVAALVVGRTMAAGRSVDL